MKFSNDQAKHVFVPCLGCCDVNVLVLFFVAAILSFGLSWPHILR